MDSMYTRRTSMEEYRNEDVCKQGFFIKSPPLHLFGNQSSWKRRHFILSKSSNGYLLKYHKGQHNKGCIEINESSEIEIGIGVPDRMAAVKKMFKCQVSEVMTIKTEERVYYLIGTDSVRLHFGQKSKHLCRKVCCYDQKLITETSSRQQRCTVTNENPVQFSSQLLISSGFTNTLRALSKDVEEWADFLFAACKQKQTNTWQTLDEAPLQTTSRNRSQTSPAFLNEYESNEYEELFPDKKRPISYPISEEHPYESPRKCIARQRQLPSNHGVGEEQKKGKSEKEEEEKSEQPYYATPRSVLAELDHVIAECNNPVENPSPNDSNGDQAGVYMPMKNLMIKEKIQPVHTSAELVTSPRSQKNNTELKGDLGSQRAKSNARNNEPSPENRTKHLTVVQLSRLLNKITDDSQLEEVNILLPQNDAIDCLTFTEAIGRVCVSQWKAPHHLNCIFHHGDHILAVNDLHVTNIDEVLFFIKRSTGKEVKLTVRRLPDSKCFPH